MLQEIFDEASYKRFLNETAMMSSSKPTGVSATKWKRRKRGAPAAANSKAAHHRGHRGSQRNESVTRPERRTASVHLEPHPRYCGNLLRPPRYTACTCEFWALTAGRIHRLRRGGDGRLRETLLPACGAIKLSPREPLPRRLSRIYQQLGEIICKHQPDEVAIEDVFYALNVKSALKLGQVRGVAMLAAASAGLEVAEYSPLTIKSSVVGYGRAPRSSRCSKW